MSTILSSYDWSYVSKNNKKARSRQYPWDDWFDGRIWQLEPKEDFDGPATSLERVIRTSANRRRLKVRVRIDGKNIVVQRHEDEEPTRGVTKSPTLKSLRENGIPKGEPAAPRTTKPRSQLAKSVRNGEHPTKIIKRRHATV